MFNKKNNKVIEDSFNNINSFSSTDMYNNDLSKVIIGTDVKYKGEISEAEEVEIEGTVNAKINTNNLIIREQGSLKGKIVANNITVWGKLNGNIKVSDTLIIHEHGIIFGKIEYFNLEIKKGGIIKGEINTLS